MNRPDFLQYLTKGKILSSKIFPKFVDTWNWLVSAFDSFVGDANLNPVEGFILVDRTDPSHPILRLTNTDKLGGGGEGGGGETITLPKKPFDFVNGYVEGGSIPCPVAYLSANGHTITEQTTVVYLHIDLSTGSASSSYVLTINETSRANSATHAQYKLYEITNGKVTLDCRPTVIPVLAL